MRVESVENPKPGGARVGDSFLVSGATFRIPDGGSFDALAFLAVAPVLVEFHPGMDPDGWFARKPYLCGQDPHEDVVMRLELVQAPWPE